LEKSNYWLILLAFLVYGCGENIVDDPKSELLENETYFPPKNSEKWETLLPESLGWSLTELEELYHFHEENGTRAFLIIKKGKIIVEKYWGKDIRDEDAFNQDKPWYWASASKTLVALTTGIAQEQGYLDINDQTSQYLGQGWTSLTSDKESLITIKHQLTMTTGLDSSVPDLDCTVPECLHYGVDAGDSWFYHNAPYTLLNDVIANASNINFDDYVKVNIADQIGMNGFWLPIGHNRMYNSTARDAGRLGLLLENNGVWANKKIISDEDFLKDMLNSSQELNPSYGYLTWLNGKSSVALPERTNSFNTSLAPEAPVDLFAAMGKNGQFIDVVPSQDLVVIRMGEAPDNSLVPVLFHNEMWGFISKIVK
jgi:CubicO group peptidase (beta-lactamase class C family)